MESNVCKIENGTADLAAILKESEKVAVYNGLNHKQTLQLRLICEEIDGMLPNIVENFEGKLWIEFLDGVCKVNASVKIINLDADKKNDLVGIAKNKKNAAAVGIVGKIRNALENFLLVDESVVECNKLYMNFGFSTGFSDGVDYNYLWSLVQYRNQVTADKHVEEWDELEKSVISSVADDVIVGIKGNQADIVIVKKFY